MGEYLNLQNLPISLSLLRDTDWSVFLFLFLVIFLFLFLFLSLLQGQSGVPVEWRSEPMKVEENRDNIDKTAYWWPTDDPYSWSNVKNPGCWRKRTG